MTKKISTVYVETAISDYCKENNINLSVWLNNKFSDEFLNIEAKKKELGELQQKIAKISQDLVDFAKNNACFPRNLTKNQENYLRKVPKKVKEGYDIFAMNKYFNETYDVNYSVKEFKNLVKQFEN